MAEDDDVDDFMYGDTQDGDFVSQAFPVFVEGDFEEVAILECHLVSLNM